MTKKELSLARRALRLENAKYGPELVRIPREEWPIDVRYAERAPLEAWRSRDFLVMRFEVPRALGKVIRLSVCRAILDDEGKWGEGISWDELQRIKDELGYTMCDAIEIYPRAFDVVNVANMRHLWVKIDGKRIPFAWRKGNEHADQWTEEL